MIKFEIHEGQLFLMLEKPVPLKEKDTNVLVQFITHGVIGEYVMEHWLDCGQENAPIFVDSVDSDGDVIVFIENGNEHYGCPFPMFEIIGIFVVEGSKEWAMYQMMQGLKVCNPQLAKSKAARFGCDYEKFNTYWYVVGDTVVEGKGDYGTLSVSSWIAAASSTGWQIYKEPKPEPKPLLADAKVGDLCKTDLDEWIQIDDTSEPPSPILYHYDRPFKGNIIHTEPLAPEGSKEWAVQRMKLGDKVTKGYITHIYWEYDARPHLKCISEYNCGTLQIMVVPEIWITTADPTGWQIYKEPESQYKVGDWVELNMYWNHQGQIKEMFCAGKYQIDGIEFNRSRPTFTITGLSGEFYYSSITRKLSPSEVVLDFGSGIKGWICYHSYKINEKVSKYNIDVFSTTNQWLATLAISALDTRTRELVESLLEAMQGEK